MCKQGAGKWLAGTHPESWWVWTETDTSEAEREQISTNWTYILNTAIANLHKCLWFGLVEEIDKSLRMFEYQTGLQMKMGHINRNIKYQKPDKDTVLKIKKLIPSDLYIYEYAKELFKFRWQLYLNNSLPRSLIVLPPTIYGCTSTNHYLNCPTFKK